MTDLFQDDLIPCSELIPIILPLFATILEEVREDNAWIVLRNANDGSLFRFNKVNGQTQFPSSSNVPDSKPVAREQSNEIEACFTEPFPMNDKAEAIIADVLLDDNEEPINFLTEIEKQPDKEEDIVARN